MDVPKQGYLDMMAKRSKESRAYQKHQSIGLELAEILGDREHKSLYIKLAKENSATLLLSLAKDVSTRKDVKNYGAYFMRVLTENKLKNKKTNGSRLEAGK